MDPLSAKVVAAASGATLTALTMTPFDVVKTRLQTQPPAPPSPLFTHPPTPTKCCQPSGGPCVRQMSTYARPLLENEVVCLWDHGTMRAERVTGFGDALVKVWRVEGIRGLWKGVGTSLAISVPSATLYMVTYDYLFRDFYPSLAFVPASISPMLAGITARTLITSTISPLELLRTNLQSTPISANNPHTLSSVLTSVRNLVAVRGLSSLWRGLGPTLWRDVPFSGIYWASYERLKAQLNERGIFGVKVSFASGVAAGTTAAILTSPFDVLKTRRQALLMSSAIATPHGAQPPSATFSLLGQIVRTEGVSALYAGLAPRMAKIAPACGIMIACYEGIGSFLLRKD